MIVDASRYQRLISHQAAVDGGLETFIARTSIGVSGDNYAAYNARAFRDLGVAIEFYHGLSNDNYGSQWDIQAEGWMVACKGAGWQPGERLWLDAELPGLVLSMVRSILNRTDAWTGQLTGIYTSRSKWTLGAGFGHRPLLVADYGWDGRGGGWGIPRLPTGWTTYDTHQYTESGIVPGFARPVDVSRRNPNPTGPATTGTTRVRLNLRAQPTTLGAVLAVMPTGTVVTLLAQPVGGWVNVRYGALDGFCSADPGYITLL